MSNLNVSGTTAATSTYTSYKASDSDSTTKTTETPAAKAAGETGAVYEKSESTAKGAYSINKMSQEERTALVAKLKAEQESRTNQLMNIVSQMLGKQANTSLQAGSDDMWKLLASGKFEVDPATKAQAQEDISEDGYWGVKQTSQRMFDFASALAGDDPEKMKKMQEAMEKGFKQAEETWGRELPGISQETIKAARQLFEDYFNSKESTTIA